MLMKAFTRYILINLAGMQVSGTLTAVSLLSHHGLPSQSTILVSLASAYLLSSYSAVPICYTVNAPDQWCIHGCLPGRRCPELQYRGDDRRGCREPGRGGSGSMTQSGTRGSLRLFSIAGRSHRACVQHRCFAASSTDVLACTGLWQSRAHYRELSSQELWESECGS